VEETHSLLPGRNDSLDVSRTVQDPDYLDAFGYLAVKDNVVSNRKAAQGSAKLIACAAHLRKASEGLTMLVDRIEEASALAGPSSAT
jgi:hypothetical protein